MNPELEQIQHVLQRLLREYLGKDVPLSAGTNLTADLDLESVQIMEYIVEVEDHFDIAIDLERLSNTHTIAELAETVVESR